jgi:hypothetical protein
MADYISLYQIIDRETKKIKFDGFKKDRWEKSYPYCFSDYAYSPRDFGKRIVSIKVLKEYGEAYLANMLLTKNQVYDYIRKMNAIGFKCKIKNNVDHYLISFDERDYLCLSHVRIALDFIRLLWEDHINVTLDVLYNKLPKSFVRKYKGEAFFEFIQGLSFFMVKYFRKKGSYGHMLPCVNYLYKRDFSIVSLQKMREFFSDNNKHSSGSYAVWTAIGEKGETVEKATEIFKEYLEENLEVKKKKRGRVASKSYKKTIKLVNKEKELAFV